MKKVIAFLAMAILLSGVSGIIGCAHQGTSVLGSYVNPISGARYEFVRAADADPWGNDHGVIYAVATDSSGKNINPNEFAMQNGASSPGIGKQTTVGVATGLASNPGPWFGLIPRFNNTNNNNGGNNSQSQGQGQHQRQGQGQLQNQNQGQVNAPTTVNNNTNVNTPVANAIQNQAQGQSTGPFSPVTAIAP